MNSLIDTGCRRWRLTRAATSRFKHVNVACGILRFVFPALLGIHLAGCGKQAPLETHASTQSTVSNVQTRSEARGPGNGTNAATDQFSIYTYEVVKVWPHDRGAFTQGLVFLDGALLESTGLNGQSSLRKVDLASGSVLKRLEVPSQYFAEGLALLNGKLFQLTWKNQKGFVYDLESFRLEKEFAYAGEGWGLTTDGHWLIMSDGTEQIRFLDPSTFEEKRRITVLARGHPVDRLNELEYIKGEIFANVWGSPYVVRIDPSTGRVAGVVDFTGLLPDADRDAGTDVLNGIAYDVRNDRLFVTGKRWPKLFEVRLRLKK